eukprot:s680_g10.t1
MTTTETTQTSTSLTVTTITTTSISTTTISTTSLTGTTVTQTATTVTTTSATATSTTSTTTTIDCLDPFTLSESGEEFANVNTGSSSACNGISKSQSCSVTIDASSTSDLSKCVAAGTYTFFCPNVSAPSYLYAADAYIQCRVCAATFVDTDTSLNSFAGKLMFGPNLLNGAVDETMLDNYVVLPMDDCGYIPSGVAPLAVVPKSANASDCCETTKYEVDLSLPNFAYNKIVIVPAGANTTVDRLDDGLVVDLVDLTTTSTTITTVTVTTTVVTVTAMNFVLWETRPLSEMTLGLAPTTARSCSLRCHWPLLSWFSLHGEDEGYMTNAFKPKINVSNSVSKSSAPPAPLSMSIAVLFIGANHALSSAAPSSKSRSNRPNFVAVFGAGTARSHDSRGVDSVLLTLLGSDDIMLERISFNYEPNARHAGEVEAWTETTQTTTSITATSITTTSISTTTISTTSVSMTATTLILTTSLTVAVELCLHVLSLLSPLEPLLPLSEMTLGLAPMTARSFELPCRLRWLHLCSLWGHDDQGPEHPEGDKIETFTPLSQLPPATQCRQLLDFESRPKNLVFRDA